MDWTLGRTITDTVVTAIDAVSSGSTPAAISLEQNYPNPFHSSTGISFSIPARSYVSLRVFDPLGREAATIIAEELSSGKHSVQWKAKGLCGRMYFYRLQSGSSVITKRLMLNP